MAIAFDYNFYLEQKLAQLQGQEGYEDFTNTAQVVAAFEEAGLTVKEHYEQFGAGEGLNPSADFDTNAYLNAKLEQLQGQEGYEDIQTTDDVLAAFKEAGLSPLEHYNQFGIDEGLEATPAAASALTEGLATLATAEEAREEFLLNDAADADLVADYLEDNNLDEEDAEVVAAAVDQVYTDEIADLNGEINVGTVSADRSDAYNSAVIEEQQSVNAERLEDAQDAVADEEGLQQAVNALTSAQAAYGTAVEAQEDTSADVDGAVARFATLQGEQGNGSYTALSADAEADDLDVVTINGANAISFVDGELVVAEGFEGEEGADALLAAVQADFNAIQAVAAAEGNLGTAVAGVLDIESEGWDDGQPAVTADSFAYTDSDSGTVTEAGVYTDTNGDYFVSNQAGDTFYSATSSENDGVVTFTYASNETSPLSDASGLTEVTAADYEITAAVPGDTVASYLNLNDADNGYLASQFATDAPLATELNGAQNAVEELNDAVSEYQAAKALAGELDGLDTSVEEAEDYLTDDEEDGGLGVTLLDLGESLTSGDDVVLFSDAEDTAQDVANFGAQGEDRIYFGNDFEFVALGEDEQITDRVGSADQKEIFWQQDGNDLNIYVEAVAEAGRDTATTDITTITLTGVSIDDVDFSGGFLTAGEVA